MIACVNVLCVRDLCLIVRVCVRACVRLCAMVHACAPMRGCDVFCDAPKVGLRLGVGLNKTLFQSTAGARLDGTWVLVRSGRDWCPSHDAPPSSRRRHDRARSVWRGGPWTAARAVPAPPLSAAFVLLRAAAVVVLPRHRRSANGGGEESFALQTTTLRLFIFTVICCVATSEVARIHKETGGREKGGM